MCIRDRHHDVGELGAALAHLGECGMAGGIEEADHALRRFNVIRADVLRNSAGFAIGHFGAANVVQQRGLAVVNVAHDGDPVSYTHLDVYKRQAQLRHMRATAQQFTQITHQTAHIGAGTAFHMQAQMRCAGV